MHDPVMMYYHIQKAVRGNRFVQYLSWIIFLTYQAQTVVADAATTVATFPCRINTKVYREASNWALRKSGAHTAWASRRFTYPRSTLGKRCQAALLKNVPGNEPTLSMRRGLPLRIPNPFVLTQPGAHSCLRSADAQVPILQRCVYTYFSCYSECISGTFAA